MFLVTYKYFAEREALEPTLSENIIKLQITDIIHYPRCRVNLNLSKCLLPFQFLGVYLGVEI